MKLAIIGAGSSRLPLMLAAIARTSHLCSSVCLYDIRPERIEALLPVARVLAAECGILPHLEVAQTPKECLEGASAVIFTIRPGFEEARAIDERTCLSLGVLGQETTGAAGLALAHRTLPVLARYCESASSNPLLIIFSNPAGLLTQGLQTLGFYKAVGVCDSANVAITAVATRANVPVEQTDFEVYGLNHLSWTRRVSYKDADLLGPALSDEAFLKGRFFAFSPELLRELRRIPVEYLYYYLKTEEALQAMRSKPLTRGEELVEANASMFEDVGRLVASGEVRAAVVRYAQYVHTRLSTYMDYAHDQMKMGEVSDALAFLADQIGGYAEVATTLLEAYMGHGRLMVLNTANNGSIQGLDDDDVIESDCEVSGEGFRARAHDALPEEDLRLIFRVKEYERLAIRAILEDSIELARDALVAHPLVGDRQLANRLIEAGLFNLST